MTLAVLWHGLLWPLARLLLFVSLGMMVGNFIEALNWTQRVAKIAAPLTRLGRLSPVTGASFSMAFFSGVAANTMLAEAYDQKELPKLELVLANLFNSLPRFFLHLPTVFFLTAPLIKGAAVIYVGLTLAAAVLQTSLVVVAGRLLLPGPAAEQVAGTTTGGKVALSWREALKKSWLRFRKRFKKIIRFTVPVYILFFLLNHYGVFGHVQQLLADHAPLLAWLHPQSLGIVALHVTAEFAAGLAAAGALLDAASIGYRDVVLALLVGNVLASPVRAMRHQFPYYAGIFSPRLAVELILYSQTFRVVSIVLVGTGYYYLSN
ncbi:MAG: hypothetical protein ABFS18_05725 [Thermodesulfobacteriota bacterium]